MCGQLGDVLRVHSAHGHGGTDDGILVITRNVGAGQHDIGEYHTRVWRVGSDLGLLAFGEGCIYPLGLDDGDHHGDGGVILRKLDRVRDDVGDGGKRERPVAFLRADLASKLDDALRQLQLVRQSVRVNLTVKER